MADPLHKPSPHNVAYTPSANPVRLLKSGQIRTSPNRPYHEPVWQPGSCHHANENRGSQLPISGVPNRCHTRAKCQPQTASRLTKARLTEDTASLTELVRSRRQASANTTNGIASTDENLVSRDRPRQAPATTAKRPDDTSARSNRKEKYSAAVTNRAARFSLVTWWDRQRFAGRNPAMSRPTICRRGWLGNTRRRHRKISTRCAMPVSAETARSASTAESVEAAQPNGPIMSAESA